MGRELLGSECAAFADSGGFRALGSLWDRIEPKIEGFQILASRSLSTYIYIYIHIYIYVHGYIYVAQASVSRPVVSQGYNFN